MGTYYCYFNTKTREYINIGKKYRDQQGNDEYQGVRAWIRKKWYSLPKKYMNLLIQRFKEGYFPDEIIFLTDDELFTEKYIIDDDKDGDMLRVGGDSYFDPPLSKYLPEINQESVQDEIVNYREPP